MFSPPLHPLSQKGNRLTFGDAERIVTTCYKIVKCNKKIGVALSSSKQVLLGAPPDGFIQCLGFSVTTVGAVKSFWGREKNG